MSLNKKKCSFHIKIGKQQIIRYIKVINNTIYHIIYFFVDFTNNKAIFLLFNHALLIINNIITYISLIIKIFDNCEI